MILYDDFTNFWALWNGQGIIARLGEIYPDVDIIPNVEEFRGPKGVDWRCKGLKKR